MTISNDFAVDIDELTDELASVGGLKDAVSSANGELRSKIKEILDSKDYHKNAFAIIRALNDMNDTKLADVLRCFKPMFDAMYEHKWRPLMMDLVSEAESDAKELEDS